VTEAQVKNDIGKLYGRLSARTGKYTRNFNRYTNNGVRREDLWTPYTAPQAYVAPARDGGGVQTQINLIKSCVDSIASKISQANVRPFFNPVNGDFDTRQACQQAQHFTDVWLDENHAYPKSVMCFRDAAIFDIGVLGIDPMTQSISRVAPWEYFIDPAEYQHGAISRAMLYRKHFPLAKLITRPEDDAKSIDNPELVKIFERDPFRTGELVTYYDLYNGFRHDFFDKITIHDPIQLDFEQYGGLFRRPFVEMYYTKPMKGFYSTSLADDLYPIQRQVDEMVVRLDAATRKSGLQWIWIPTGSNVKASNLENGINVYNYTPGAEGGPPTIMNPDPISAQYIQLLEMYIDKAYSMAGISQLSAQAKKPSGLNSGKGLETMEDIESDRFNTQLQQFTHFLVDTMRVCIDTFPAKLPILPNKIGRGKVTWGDLRKQRDLFSLQFSAASALSKDPEEKINQINLMVQGGFLDKAQAADMMDLPDTEGAHSMASSSLRHVEHVIDQALKAGDVDYSPAVDLTLLKSMAIKTLNQLEAAEDKPEYIARINDLITKVVGDLKNLGAVAAPDAPLPPPPPMLEGQQIAQLSAILSGVTAGTMLPAAAQPLISASFPMFPPDMIQAMVQGAIAAPPAPPAAVNPTQQEVPNVGIPQ
jgi:hypothetical protein